MGDEGGGFKGGVIISVLTTHMYRYKRIDQDQNHHDTFDSSSLSFPLLFFWWHKFLTAPRSLSSHFLSLSLAFPPSLQVEVDLPFILYLLAFWLFFRYACSALIMSSLV